MAYTKYVDHGALSDYSEGAMAWLGAIAADGNICTHKNGINPTIGYGSIDIEHVAKFKVFMKSDHKISTGIPRTKFGVGQMVGLLRFTSGKVGDLLLENGITPRKSLTLKVSERLATSPHFWRGAAEGDGCYSPNMNGRGCPRIYLVGGSLAFIEQYSDFCESIGPRPKLLEVEGLKHRCWRAESYGDNACCVLEVLYANPVETLGRKRSVAEKILAKKFQVSEASEPIPWYDSVSMQPQSMCA